MMKKIAKLLFAFILFIFIGCHHKEEITEGQRPKEPSKNETFQKALTDFQLWRKNDTSGIYSDDFKKIFDFVIEECQENPQAISLFFPEPDEIIRHLEKYGSQSGVKFDKYEGEQAKLKRSPLVREIESRKAEIKDLNAAISRLQAEKEENLRQIKLAEEQRQIAEAARIRREEERKKREEKEDERKKEKQISTLQEEAKNKLAKMNIEYSKTAFLKYVKEGDITVVNLFLAAKMDPNTKDSDDSWTAFELAAYRGHTKVVQALLAKGAEVNAKDNSGQTALMFAAMNGHTEVIQTLLAKGAEVNAKSNSGYTVLMIAADRGHAEVIQVLLAKGAEVNAKDNSGQTALMWAAMKGHTEIVNLLKNAGAKE